MNVFPGGRPLENPCFFAFAGLYARPGFVCNRY
jgi:hypothetical protein